jgi:propanediol dehydratase small subunit
VSDDDATLRYPLGEHHADTIRAHSGRPLAEVTLEAAMAGELSPEDLTAHRETLEAQAAIAAAAGYAEIAANLRRAAELTNIPNDEVLAIYEALRPGRRTYHQLLSLSQEIGGMYAADETARYIREAADAYRDSGLLKVDD